MLDLYCRTDRGCTAAKASNKGSNQARKKVTTKASTETGAKERYKAKASNKVSIRESVASASRRSERTKPQQNRTRLQAYTEPKQSTSTTLISTRKVQIYPYIQKKPRKTKSAPRKNSLH